MIQIDDPQLYERSLLALSAYTRGSYSGRLVQIFFACKRFGDAIPKIGDGLGIPIRELQDLLDNLYDKPSLRPAPSVVSLFSANHLYPTGVAGPGLTGAANIWRNNFNIQKGYCCFATTAELQDPVFRAMPRVQCPHLRPQVAGQMDGAACEFAPDSHYRREDHPKVFRLDPDSRDVTVADPHDTTIYGPIVRTPNGRALPVVPLIVALYYDSEVAAGRTQVDIADFVLDFNFSRGEFGVYFDADPALDVHQQLVADFPALTWTRPQLAPPAPAAVVPPLVARRGRRRYQVPRVEPEDLPLVAPPIAPPAGTHWWHAEQAVKTALEQQGWHVVDRTRQGAGFDFQVSTPVENLTVPPIENLTDRGGDEPQFVVTS